MGQGAGPRSRASKARAFFSRRRTACVAVRYGTATTDADGVLRDNQCGRKLPTLELVGGRLDTVQQLIDQPCIMARRDNLFGNGFLLKVKLQDGINPVV